MKAIFAIVLIGFFLQFCNALSLRQLYNSRVIKAERYQRPLDSGKATPQVLQNLVYHCGVVVTLENGQRWLVHKGNEYGQASNTVVVSASYMNRVWTKIQEKTISRSRVTDYVRAGGVNYNLFLDNCIHACTRMMQLN
jgi:hypothetical protein